MVSFLSTRLHIARINLVLCSPGRFFASNELKAMFAHLLVTYDVKFENEGVRPPNQWFAGNCVPNQKAEVMFRKRQQ